MTPELAGKKLLTTLGLSSVILLKGDKKKHLDETCFSRMSAASFSVPPGGVLAAELGLGDLG